VISLQSHHCFLVIHHASASRNIFPWWLHVWLIVMNHLDAHFFFCLVKQSLSSLNSALTRLFSSSLFLFILLSSLLYSISQQTEKFSLSLSLTWAEAKRKNKENENWNWLLKIKTSVCNSVQQNITMRK
jgi:hypothetical protein